MEIFETGDGSHSILSDQFGVTYHSKHGAVQEAQHVFINAALRMKATIQDNISILEIGFGTGLNALMTCLEAQKRNLKIQYVAVEAYPISLETVQSLNYGEVLPHLDATDFFTKIHAADWEIPTMITDNFTITKVKKRFEDLTYQNQFDIIYFDAFAPNSQPELWTKEFMQIMYNALLPKGILTTYCAKGQVKRNMKAIGFLVEKLPGPPGKREMTRACRPKI